MGDAGTYSLTAQTSPTDQDQISVKGRLFSCYNFWKNNLNASEFVLSVISRGYILPLQTQPPPFFAKNNVSSLNNREFVETEILNYVKKGYIKEISEVSYCCNPLTVAEGKKLRLVLDLRHVNKYLNTPHFKYEDLRVVADLLNQNDFFTSFDLVSGYFHIDISPEHYKYLGFQWIFTDGSIKNFQFVVLVFGLAPACYLFTKITKPLVKYWRLLGFRVALYLDDGFNAASTSEKCKKSTKSITESLESAGFVINQEKSNLQPRQVGEWLGSVINTIEMKYSVPEAKVKKLKQRLASIETKSKVTSRFLSKITGQLSSMYLSLGPIVRLMTRSLFMDIQSHPEWDAYFYLSTDSIAEVKF